MSTIIVFLILAGLYLLPAIIASERGHPHLPQIFLLNLLLGWTGFGWALAALWALTSGAHA